MFLPRDLDHGLIVQLNRLTSLILSRRYTTNVLLGYCQDGRLSTLHPFPLDSDGPEPRRYSP
jgi:hypothetical protein